MTNPDTSDGLRGGQPAARGEILDDGFAGVERACACQVASPGRSAPTGLEVPVAIATAPPSTVGPVTSRSEKAQGQAAAPEVAELGPDAPVPATDDVDPAAADRAARRARLRTATGTELSPVTDLTDLVVAAKAGDKAAFSELVRLTYVDTYTLALRLTGDEEDARDVAQEAYLRAYKGLRRFRGDARFTTWLYRITANCASNQLGKRSRHRHEDLEESGQPADLDPAIDPEGRADAADLKVRLESALDDLPAKLQAVVVLRDVYGLSHEAIASELGISESAAKVRLHRARRKLKDRLFPGRDAGVGEALEATSAV
jgi:RNA polymerase sigma-70 factor (ECF subfamily)